MKAAKEKTLSLLLEDYLLSCHPEDEKGKGRAVRFPNLAGFCRSLGCGPLAYAKFEERYPEAADWLCAVFEDEVLNASTSPTVLSSYLKKRLGYMDRQGKLEESEAECGMMRLVFEHNIEEDGE